MEVLNNKSPCIDNERTLIPIKQEFLGFLTIWMEYTELTELDNTKFISKFPNL
jgi:hypothetical protein